MRSLVGIQVCVQVVTTNAVCQNTEVATRNVMSFSGVEFPLNKAPQIKAE